VAELIPLRFQANELQHQLEEARREEEIARLRAETEARDQAVLEARQTLPLHAGAYSGMYGVVGVPSRL